MTKVIVGFDDPGGLIEALRAEASLDVGYSDEGLDPASVSEGLWIGALVPFETNRLIITAALERYPHLKFYSISTDHYKVPDFVHRQIMIGGLTETANSIGISEIDATSMLEKIKGFNDNEELFGYVRSFYQNPYETFPVEA